MPPEPTHRRIKPAGRGVELELLEWGGRGPLTLLCHANGFCAGVWGPVAQGLRTRFRVMAYDARGHGDSSRPRGDTVYSREAFTRDLIAVAELLTGELGLPRIELSIGHSFGGTIAMLAASHRPDLFGRLAMLDPVFAPPGQLRSRPARVDSANRMAEIARKRRHLWPSRDAARSAWREREPFQSWDPRVFELYLRHGLRDRRDGQVELKCPGEVEATIYESDTHLDVFPAAEKLEAPTLLVWASRGNFSRESFEALASTAPRMQLVTLDADHLLPMVEPDAVTELLLSFAPEE